jgi:hypothetical protein
MSFANEGKKTFEKGTATVRSAINKGEVGAEEAKHAAEQSFVIANDALRQFNLRLLELARENSDATFDFLGALANAKNIQAIAELWSVYAQRQQERWSRQAQELTNLGQRFATQNADTVSQAAKRLDLPIDTR